MIDIKIDRQHKQTPQSIEIEGSTVDILYDLCFAIASIYQSMRAKDPINAEGFRRTLGTVLAPGERTWELQINQTTIDLDGIKK